MPKNSYGWLPEIGDHRDIQFKLSAIPIPSSIDLRDKMPPVYDQGQLGSCVANAVGAAFQYEHVKQGLENFPPSRLFLYYNTRVIERTVRSDSGCFIRDCIKTIRREGAPPEECWPYNIEKFAIAPPIACYQVGKQHAAVEYQKLPPARMAILEALARGFPVVFGFTVYESFDSLEVSQTGVVPLPKKREAVYGGHAVTCVGYDKLKQHFIIRNSWGESWGDKGHCYFPFGYLSATDASDFWIIKKVS